MKKDKCCCTYCAWLSTSNGIYCGAKEKELSYNYARNSYHKCSEFEFNEINAFDFETIYKPRENKIINGQIQLDLGVDKPRKGEVMSLEELESYEPGNMYEQEYDEWFWGYDGDYPDLEGVDKE